MLGALFELSAALGAFVGGMVVGTAKDGDWIHEHLEPFRVVFVALFLVSVGLLVDLDFLVRHLVAICALTIAILVVNTAVNGTIFRLLGDDWRTSLFAGSLLAQIGELSFVLAAVGRQTQLITDFSYQMTVAVIALTLIFSPAWVGLVGRLAAPQPQMDPPSSQA